MKIDVAELNELGFDHFDVECDGVPVDRCYAVDTEIGKAFYHRVEDGKADKGVVEGEITVVFPEKRVRLPVGQSMIQGDEG